MKTRTNWLALPALATAALMLGATTPAPQRSSNWNTTVTRTASGSHLIGNPRAEVRLTEYVSYTCPHCAAFARSGDNALELAYVGPGRVQLEVRNFVRDPVDLTAAMLANCGPASKFPQNHKAFMSRQASWLPTLANRTPAQVQRWTTGDYAARRRAMATDFGFYTIMESRGYTRAEANRCLADNALAARLSEGTRADANTGVTGTPSFAVNGRLLAGVHDWTALAPVIDAAL